MRIGKGSTNLRGFVRVARIALLGTLLGASHTVSALPTIFFDGQLDYTATSGQLSITGALTAYQEMTTAPVLAGSSVDIHADLVSSISASGITTGNFGPASGFNPDVSIIGGDSTNLFAGNVSDLILRGPDGLDFGVLVSDVTPTTGALLVDFTNPSNVFSLVLNLNTVFSPSMFGGDFGGQIDGRLAAVDGAQPALGGSASGQVSEPATLSLVGIGLLGFVGLRRARH